MDPRAEPPRVWVLLGYGAGGNAQMHTLARALGWPYEAKQVVYNALNRLPNPLLGASLCTVDRARSDKIEPPWPDLVIAASRRAAPVARWIKQASGGHTRLVHLLHAQAPLAHFDLIVTLPQYRLPSAPNVMMNTLPLNRPDPEALTAARKDWSTVFADLPRPRIGVLIGGNSSSYRLDAETARRLARQVDRQAHAEGGSLLVSTSRRTPPEATKAVWSEISQPAYCYNWTPDPETNPFFAILADADKFVVTPDSASMPTEATLTGRPVQVFDRSLGDSRRSSRSVGKLGIWLIRTGWYKPRRDFHAFHAGLYAHGLVNHDPPQNTPPDDLGRTVVRIRALVPDH